MGLMDIHKELEAFKGLGVSLKHNPKQTKYLIRDLTTVKDDLLWNELSELRGTALLSFREMGRRLKELQFRYSKNGYGGFEKKYQELGLKKGEVYTLINKYDLYILDTSKEETIFLTNEIEDKVINEVIEGEIIDDLIVRGEDNQNVEIKLDRASQKIISELTKSPPEIREKFYTGEINTPAHIKEARENFKAGEIIKPAIIEDDRRAKRIAELTKELKDIDSEIKELLEVERKLKRLREQRDEVIDELSKVNNLTLNFKQDKVYIGLMKHLENRKAKFSSSDYRKNSEINLKDDWWKSRAFEYWQDNKEKIGITLFKFEEKYCK